VGLQNKSKCHPIRESSTINAPVVAQSFILQQELAACIVPILIHTAPPNKRKVRMNNFQSKGGKFALIILLVAILSGIYVGTRPRLVPGQAPLADIATIETLRMQFNQDTGKTRLILLASPT
jgi:hypothetical protein